MVHDDSFTFLDIGMFENYNLFLYLKYIEIL